MKLVPDISIANIQTSVQILHFIRELWQGKSKTKYERIKRTRGDSKDMQWGPQVKVLGLKPTGCVTFFYLRSHTDPTD